MERWINHVSMDTPNHVSMDKPNHVSMDKPNHVSMDKPNSINCLPVYSRYAISRLHKIVLTYHIKSTHDDSVLYMSQHVSLTTT